MIVIQDVIKQTFLRNTQILYQLMEMGSNHGLKNDKLET